MASRFNILLHGSASDAADLLSGDCQPETETVIELRAALTNALNRVAQLEKTSHPPIDLTPLVKHELNKLLDERTP